MSTINQPAVTCQSTYKIFELKRLQMKLKVNSLFDSCPSETLVDPLHLPEWEKKTSDKLVLYN